MPDYDGGASSSACRPPTSTAPRPSWSASELLATLLGVLAAAGIGTWVVRRQVAPLREVAATAHRVSELPLASGEIEMAERVPDRLADDRTEIGQVGAALNAMLDHVEASLAQRHRSEQQVRQFVADASHELRTPLATIAGYTELARRRPETTATALAKVETESARMTALVEDLLLLARLDAGRPLERTPVDLSRLLLEAVNDARVVDPDHQWRLSLPDAPLSVVGDEARLHQVVTNLLTNARKYTPAGSTVTVTGTTAGFTVHDDGPGFPPDLAAARLRALRPRRRRPHPRRRRRSRPLPGRGDRRRPRRLGLPRHPPRRHHPHRPPPDLTLVRTADRPVRVHTRQVGALVEIVGMEPGTAIRVEMTKWGDRPHWEFDGIHLGADEHGEWLGFPQGTVNTRPGLEFASRVGCVTLVTPDGWYAPTFQAPGIWCDIYVDIATPGRWDGDRAAGGRPRPRRDPDVRPAPGVGLRRRPRRLAASPARSSSTTRTSSPSTRSPTATPPTSSSRRRPAATRSSRTCAPGGRRTTAPPSGGSTCWPSSVGRDLLNARRSARVIARNGPTRRGPASRFSSRRASRLSGWATYSPRITPDASAIATEIAVISARMPCETKKPPSARNVSPR